MNITSAQDPSLFPGPFSIDDQGLLRTPSQGLRGQAPKVSMASDLRIDMDWIGPPSLESYLSLATLTNTLAAPMWTVPLSLAVSRKWTDLWLWDAIGPLTYSAVFMAIKLGEKTLDKVVSEKEVPSLKWSFLQFPGFYPQHHKNKHPLPLSNWLLATLT